jgi:hypothetical protein
MLEKILDNFKSNIAREKYPYDEENNPESKITYTDGFPEETVMKSIVTYLENQVLV